MGRCPMVQQFAHGVATAAADVIGRQTDCSTDTGIEMGKAIEAHFLPLAAAVTLRAKGRHLTDVQGIAKAQTLVFSFSLDALTG